MAVRVRQSFESHGEVWIQLQRAEAGGRTFLGAAGVGKNVPRAGMNYRRKRLELHRAPRRICSFRRRVRAAADEQAPAQPVMGLCAGRIERDRLSQLAFSDHPIPVIGERDVGDRNVGLRYRVVQRESLRRRSLRPRIRLARLQRTVDRQHVVAVREAAVCERVLRIGSNGSLEVLDPPAHVVGISLVQKEAALQVEVVRLRVVGGRLHELRLFPHQRHAQLASDCSRELFLHVEKLAQFPVVRLGPDVAAILGAYELNRDAEGVSRFSDTSFQHGADVQPPADLTNIQLHSLE